MAKKDEVLVVRNLSVKYPNRIYKAVDTVSFSVKSGSITTLIGPNGSGKTSIIRAILGLVDFSGEIEIFGKKAKDTYQMIGYVPQRFQFDSDFPITVFEFVRMSLVGRILGKTEKQNTVKASLAQVGCRGTEKKLLCELSGGQLQRVLLARAIVNKPKLLILDEPEAGVDVAGEQSLYELLKDLALKRSMTVLVASHELDVVYTYSDQVVCVNRKLVCAGSPYNVLNQEMFEKLFGRELKFYGHEHHV